MSLLPTGEPRTSPQLSAAEGRVPRWLAPVPATCHLHKLPGIRPAVNVSSLLKWVRTAEEGLQAGGQALLGGAGEAAAQAEAAG